MFMNGKEVIEALGISARDLRKLLACGFVTAERVGRTMAYDTELILELRERSFVEPSSKCLVVRLGEPKRVDDVAWPEREWTGWNEAWDETTKRNAARGWWRVRQAEELIGSPLISVVADFVVAVHEITGCETDRGDRRFTLKDPSKSDLTKFGHKRIRLGPGPMSVRFQ